MKPSILVMGGDEDFRERLAEILKKRGYQVLTAATPDDPCIHNLADIDIVIVSQHILTSRERDIFSVFSYLKPSPEIILMLTSGSIQSAIEGMKKGVFDDIYVPFEISELEEKIFKAFRARQKKARKMKRCSLKQKIEDVFVSSTFAEANVELSNHKRKKTH
ncbi:MAG: hypothetical protein JRI45_09230 [Deltaproteobacteria bacterium]|nr:hypothetical protein [Deltaproteobacteria bacterium]MBW2067643.1 hypothetical protein [Deltaproteobacteria bacterium]